MSNRKLTPMQERFVAEYLIDLDATNAARRAGYSDRNAGKIGPALLTKPVVAAAIAAAQAARLERTQVTADEILRRLDIESQRTGKGSSHAARVKALQLLGLHAGLFPQRHQLEPGPAGAPIPLIVAHTVEERLAPYADVIRKFVAGGGGGPLRPDGPVQPVDSPQANAQANALPAPRPGQ